MKIGVENANRLLDQLERLGYTLGIVVRYEVLGETGDLAQIRSGLCRLKDDQLLLVDSQLSTVEKCSVLIKEFKRFDLCGVFVPPAIRRLIEGKESDFD
jgi:hypothetical protein